MDRAGQRLYVNRLFDVEARGHLVIDGVGRKNDVFGHRSGRALAEAIHIVFAVAHPILPAAAEAALPARHDLFRNGDIPRRQPVFLSRAVAQGNHFTDKLMARRDWWLAISLSLFIAPEERRAGEAFDVAGADPHAQHTRHDFARP